MSEALAYPGAVRMLASATAKTPQQRLGGIAGVVVIHAAIIYAFLTTLGVVKIPKTVSDLIVVNVPDLPKKTEPPATPPPVIGAPPIENAILPVVTLNYEASQPAAITLPPVPPAQPAVQGPSLPAPPAFVAPVSIANTHTIPDYPPLSRRLGEYGTARLMLTVSSSGSVSDAVIVNSSGYRRLDEAAIAWIKGHWRYRPAREGSKPVAAQVGAVVEFRLLPRRDGD